MARDPIMEQMAAQMAGGQVPPQEVEQAPPQEPGGLDEVRSHLQAALELLDQLGGADQVETEM